MIFLTVISYYSHSIEHLLKNPLIKSNIKPDFILQIGSTLVSTEIQGVISESMKNNKECQHVLIHNHRPAERADPSFTVTHQISSHVVPFLNNVRQHLEHSIRLQNKSIGSELAPLVHIGRDLAETIPEIIHACSNTIFDNNDVNPDRVSLTEPQIILGISENIQKQEPSSIANLFLSNSMPVRDAEFFLYPTNSEYYNNEIATQRINSVTVNRGASGIDGIISTATGVAEATSVPTTLLIGDLSTIHDLNSLHNLGTSTDSDEKIIQKTMQTSLLLTTIIVNNNGGGIFLSLPIAKCMATKLVMKTSL